MNCPIPLKLYLESYESILGYLARLAERNYYDRSDWIIRAIGSRSPDSGTWTSASIEALAQLTGLRPETVRGLAYVKEGDERSFYGGKIPSVLLDLTAQRYCPDCLRENGIHIGLFDLAAVQICPKHARRLSDRCLNCNTLLRWGRSSVRRCTACGADLADASTEIIPLNDVVGTAAVAKFAGFAHVHHQIAESLTEPPQPLQHLTLGEFVELLITLARYADRHVANTTFLRFRKHHRSQVHHWLSTGWNFLKDWPSGLANFLTALSTNRQHTEAQHFGLSRDFGVFYSFLRTNMQIEPWRTVKSAFLDYLEQDWEGSTTTRLKWLVERQDGPRLRYISFAEAQRRLGRSFPVARRLIERGVLKARVSGSWHAAPVFVDKGDLDVIAPGGAQPINLQEAGRRLGISSAKTKRLVESGLISPLVCPEPGESRTYLIRSTDVDDFVESIAPQCGEACPNRRKFRSFGSIMRAQEQNGLPLDKVIAAMTNGALPVVAIDSNLRGLASFLFDRVTTKRILQELMAKHDENGQGMPAALVAQRLHIQTGSVSWLVRNGYLMESNSSMPRRLRVSMRSFQEFQRRWIKGADLAGEYHTSRMLLFRALETAGIPFRRSTVEDRYAVAFFDRDLIEALDIRTLLRDASLKVGKSGADYAREWRRRKKLSHCT